MEKVFATALVFWLIVIATIFMSTGCGTPIPCTKPAIQMADMSGGMQYGHCRGLDYEGKE